MDLSNKSLALMLLAAVVVSLGGTLLSLQKINQIQSNPVNIDLTGAVTSEGDTNLSLDADVGCRVESQVDFGSAGVSSVTTIDTDSSNGDFTDCSTQDACDDMILNNTGNVDVTVNFTSDTNANSLFPDGADADSEFNFSAENATDDQTTKGGCFDGGTGFGGSIAETVTTNEKKICNNFTFDSANRLMHNEYSITIPGDASTGTKSATLTFECNQI